MKFYIVKKVFKLYLTWYLANLLTCFPGAYLFKGHHYFSLYNFVNVYLTLSRKRAVFLLNSITCFWKWILALPKCQSSFNMLPKSLLLRSSYSAKQPCVRQTHTLFKVEGTQIIIHQPPSASLCLALQKAGKPMLGLTLCSFLNHLFFFFRLNSTNSFNFSCLLSNFFLIIFVISSDYPHVT